MRYGRLLDYGREQVEKQVSRPGFERLRRWLLRKLLASPACFTPLLRAGQLLRPLLPAKLKRRIPPYQRSVARPRVVHARRMLILEGCVQPAVAPGINAAAARVLDRLGIALIPVAGAGCCGAVCHHTSGKEEGLAQARRNIDAWWPHLESEAEAIVMTASGCGVHVKNYGHLLRGDPAYADKARRVSALTQDISEFLVKEDLSVL